LTRSVIDDELESFEEEALSVVLSYVFSAIKFNFMKSNIYWWLKNRCYL